MRKKPRKSSGKQRNQPDSQQSVRIHGTTPPALLVLPMVLLGFFMSPLLVIGGTVSLGAVQNLARQDSPAVISLVGLVFGTALTGLWFYVMWKWGVWLPGITMTRFALTDRRLRFHTARTGDIEIGLEDVLTCRRQPTRYGGTSAWWIRLRHRGWVYLPKNATRATELSDYLMNRAAASKVHV